MEGVRALTHGDQSALGAALNANQELLAWLNLSCPELDVLIQAARSAGALGAKLTGGGKGGHMLALVQPEHLDQVRGHCCKPARHMLPHRLKQEPLHA